MSPYMREFEIKARFEKTQIKRKELMSYLGKIECLECNYNDYKALLIAFKEYKKGQGMTMDQKFKIYLNNPIQTQKDLIILCCTCFNKKLKKHRYESANGKHTKYQRKHDTKRKHTLMTILKQHKCQKCGEDDFNILQIDHINGLGNRKKKQYASHKRGEQRYYNTHPIEAQQDLQILCPNCNKLKQEERLEYGLIQLC